MALPGTADLIPTDPALRPGRQFRAGFAEGFGFAGLFVKFEQEPLPLADETPAGPDESDQDLADLLLAMCDRVSLRGKSHSHEGTVTARAAK